MAADAPPRRIAVVGGGLAGLAAAVTLVERSRGALDVRLFERGHALGGKASSVGHKATGTDGRPLTDDVDHGLHVFFDYPNFRALLETVEPGATRRLLRASNGSEVYRVGRSPIPLRPWPLPSPLHLLAAWRLLLEAPLDAVGLGRVMLAALLLRPERLSPEDRRRLDETSFADLAVRLGVSRETTAQEFFRAEERATFNAPFPASALAMLRTSRMVQQNHRAQSTAYVDGPTVRLVEPLAAYLGARIERFRPVVALHTDEKRVTGVRLGRPAGNPHADARGRSHYNSAAPAFLPDDADLTFDAYVAALPPRDLTRVLDGPATRLPFFDGIARLVTQKTIACQLHYDVDLSSDGPREMLVATPPPWSSVFDRARIWTTPTGGSVLEFVGEALPMEEKSDADLLAMTLRMARELYPKSAGVTPSRTWLHRSGHDDYFVTDRGSDALRPTVATPLANLFLAGDYTANSFGVVCMEGAVTSGIEAANQVLRDAGLPTRDVTPMATPGPLVEALRLLLQATGLFELLVGYRETLG